MILISNNSLSNLIYNIFKNNIVASDLLIVPLGSFNFYDKKHVMKRLLVNCHVPDRTVLTKIYL